MTLQPKQCCFRLPSPQPNWLHWKTFLCLSSSAYLWLWGFFVPGATNNVSLVTETCDLCWYAFLCSLSRLFRLSFRHVAGLFLKYVWYWALYRLSPLPDYFQGVLLDFLAVTHWTYNTIFAFLLFPSFIIISPLQNVIYELMNSEQSYMDDLSATLEVSAWWTQSWLAEEFIKLIHKKGRYCTFSHPLIVRSSDEFFCWTAGLAVIRVKWLRKKKKVDKYWGQSRRPSILAQWSYNR